MKPITIVTASAIALAGFARLSGDGPPPDKLPPPAAGKKDFVKDIKPILERYCLRCHFSPQPPKSNRASDRGGFSLSTRARAMRGGSHIGVAIVSGKSAESPLVRLVSGIPDEKSQVPAMPPRKQDRLSKEDIGKLRAWIDQGAAWPE